MIEQGSKPRRASWTWTGLGMMSGAIYFEAVIQPSLVGDAPQLVDSFAASDGMGAFLPVFLASIVLSGSASWSSGSR